MRPNSRSNSADREAECISGTAEVRRRLCIDHQLALPRRMRQSQPPGMKMQASGIGDGRQKRFLAAILAVAQNGTADGRAVHAQLVRPARARPERQEEPPACLPQ